MTQPVKFGLNADPNTGGLPIAERITAIADASGLDLVGVQDHPYNDGFTDTLTLITWLAARTSPCTCSPSRSCPRSVSPSPASRHHREQAPPGGSHCLRAGVVVGIRTRLAAERC